MNDQELQHQAKYDQMMHLADLFDSSGDEMRERASLGAEVLADEDVADSRDLSPRTFAQAEEDILAATTGKNGLMNRSVELDADALVVRATVLTYRWIDDLQVAAYKTLGSIAARAVGYLAPEVELGGAIFSAGLIETDALDREGLAAYLNELADANPELMDHFVSGGGGLVESLQLRALLTAAALGGDDGPTITLGGLRAVGAPDFPDDFGAALRDVAGEFVTDAPEPEPEDAASLARPGSIEDLMAALGSVTGEVTVQRLADGRYLAYLPGAPRGSTEGRTHLVGGDVSGRLRSTAAAIESAIDSTGSEPARVMLVGYGHGGLTAVQLAADNPSTAFVVDQVVTAGAPAAQATVVPEGTTVLALEDRADPVALLGSLIDGGAPGRLTVVFDGGDEHGASAYVAGGRAADEAGNPDLQAAIARIRDQGYLTAS